MIDRLTDYQKEDEAIGGKSHGPLGNLDDWEDSLETRCPQDAEGEGRGAKPLAFTNPNKKREEFRDHRAEARGSVKESYRLNHAYQTREFLLKKRHNIFPNKRAHSRVFPAAVAVVI